MKMNPTKFIRAAIAMLASMACSQLNAQQAQNEKIVSLSVGFSSGIPNRSSYNYALGGDIRAQKDLTRNMAAMLSLGYTEFQQSTGTGAADFAFVPLKVGARYFPLQQVYVTGEIGMGVKQHKAQRSEFLWSPGVGYSFNNGVDVGLRYEESRWRGVGRGQFAVRVAYNLNLSDIIERF